jgi:porphobilinogen synthase
LIDLTLEEIKEIYALGIRAVNIYVKVSEKLKTIPKRRINTD